MGRIGSYVNSLCFFFVQGAFMKDAITRINILETPLKASRILFT